MPSRTLAFGMPIAVLLMSAARAQTPPPASGSHRLETAALVPFGEPRRLDAQAARPITRADEEADRAEIVRRARAMIESTFTGDMTAVLKYMHPRIVQIGGEEALKKTIGSVSQQMKQLGLEFVSMDVQPPARFFSSGQRTFTTVKTRTVMQIPSKVRMTEGGSMIAVRDSPGGEWMFVRVNAQIAKDRAVLKQLFPDFPDALTLEPPAQPVSEPLGK